jgi:hypothetical protein
MAATAPTLTLRLVKTAPLTAQEMDNNLSNLKQYSTDVETQILDGTNAFSANAISGDSIDGGTASNFSSTGIDDNATATSLTLDTSGNATMSANLSVGGTLSVATTSAFTGVVTATAGVTGNLTGDVKATNGTSVLDSGTDGTDASFTGSVTGNSTGNVTGNVLATDGAAIISSGADLANSSIADGVTATTQSAGDNSTKIATTAYTDATILTAGTGIAVASGQISQGTGANGFGARTISTSSPSGGADGDIWYKVS